MSGNVLLVDDDQSLAETLAKAMTQRGFSVTYRTSAVEGLALLDEQDFDVVVTDLHKRGNAKPSSAEKLLNTIRSTLTHKEQPPSEAEAILALLQSRGFASVLDGKVTGYHLPPRYDAVNPA